MYRTHPDLDSCGQQCQQQQQQDFDAEDCCALPHLSEAALLQNLCRRYSQGRIYTYIAHVLVAVNPNKDVPGLYGSQAMQPYLQRSAPGSRPPPHPYALAAVALRGLRRGEGQAVVISGESGAGKTETAKIILSFIQRNVRVAPAAVNSTSASVERNILSMGRVLESFGNAKTSRNHNSSRFGKLLRLRLRPGQQGQEELTAQTTTYLLEASRAASRPPSERSFHIFYELFEGTTEKERSTLGLRASASHHALLRYAPTTDPATATTAAAARSSPSSSSSAPLPSVAEQEEIQRQRDVHAFRELQSALQMLRLKAEDEQGVWQVLAAIIHLGDLLFHKPMQRPNCSDKVSSSVWVANLLGVEPERLQKLIASKVNYVRGDDKPVEERRSPAQMQALLQSLIVTLYGRLFNRLVALMNISLGTCFVASGGRQEPSAELALLDIYGFENLETNSLEQLLINLTNERLQQFFEERCLRAEEHLYVREGLPCCRLVLDDRNRLQQAIGSVLDVLDDYSKQKGRDLADSNDARFCSAILGRKDMGNLIRPAQLRSRLRPRAGGRPASGAFTVQHFAGEVCYAEVGWLDRNEGGANKEIEDLLCSSSKPFFRRLVWENPEATSRPNNMRAPPRKALFSTSRRHREDLTALMAALNKAPNVQFIRCFRPNQHQMPSSVNQIYLMQQLHTSGAVQLLQLMHQGYPVRLDLKIVANRFAGALPSSIRCECQRTAAKALMLALRVPSSDFSVGVSQLFLKAGYLQLLEELSQGTLRLDQTALVAARASMLRSSWKRAAVAARCAVHLAALARAARLRRVRRSWRRALTAVLFVARIQVSVRRTKEEQERRRQHLRSAFLRASLVLVFIARLRRRAEQLREARRASELQVKEPYSSAISVSSASDTIPASLGWNSQSQSQQRCQSQGQSHNSDWAVGNRPVASPARSDHRTIVSHHPSEEVPEIRRASCPSGPASRDMPDFISVHQRLFGPEGHPGPVRASVENLFALRRWQELRPKLPEKRSEPTGGFRSGSQEDCGIPLQQPAKRWRLW